MISFGDSAPPPRLLKAFATIGYNLWPAIVKTGLGGNTYARCILTSFSIESFLAGKGFKVRLIPAILNVLLLRGNNLALGSTLGIGEPHPETGVAGIHVVCEVEEPGGRIWIVDGSTRQANRPSLWKLPPEVIIAEAFLSTPALDPEETYAKLGFRPVAATAVDQGDGTSLQFQWLTRDDYPDRWSNTPDADVARRQRIRERLDAAWKRTVI
jgi:hypothetical protein